MKKYKLLLQKINKVVEEPKFEIIILFLVYLIFIGLLFSKFNYYKWDFPGHTYQGISSLTNLKSSIYNFKYFLGFHPILYPPLSFLLRDVFSTIIPLKYVFVLLAYLSHFFLMYFIYRTSKYRNVNGVYFLLLMFIFTTISISLDSLNLFYGGTVPAFLGYLLFSYLIYYFTKNNINDDNFLVYGLLLGIALLLHTITASVFVIFFSINFIVQIISRDKQSLINHLKIGFIGLLIGSVWIVPYISMNSSIVRSGLPGYFKNEPVILILLFISLLVIKIGNYSNDKKNLTLIITSIFLFLLSMTMFPIYENGIHLTRYITYAFIISFPIVFEKTKSKHSNKLILLIIVITIPFLSFRFNTINSAYQDRIDFLDTPSYEGRLLDITDRKIINQFVHIFYTNLTESGSNRVSHGGLYVENSPNAFLATALSASVNSNTWYPLYNLNYINAFKNDSIESITDKLNLFGISHMIYTNDIYHNDLFQYLDSQGNADQIDDGDANANESSDEYISDTDEELLSNTIELINDTLPENVIEYARITDKSSNFNATVYFKTLERPSSLVQTINYIPQYVNEDDYKIEEHWQNISIDNLISTDRRISIVNGADNDFTSSNVSDISVSRDLLSFTVNSEIDTPTIIKFAYSPYLVAYSQDKYTPIYKVSPDFMMVYTKGDVQILPYVPTTFRMAWFISVVSLLATFLYVVKNYLDKKDETKSKSYKINFLNKSKIKDYFIYMLPIYYILSYVPIVIMSFYPSRLYFYTTYENFTFDNRMIFTILLLNLILSYFLVYCYVVLKNRFKNPRLFIYLFTPLLIIMFFMPFLLSRDFMAYMISPRNLVEYGKPLYLTPIFNDFNTWSKYIVGMWERNLTNLYGPLFNLIMIVIYSITRSENIYVHFLLYKLFVFIVFSLGFVFLYKLTNKGKAFDKNLILLYLNPIFVTGFLIDAHNDIFMIFLILVTLFYLDLKMNNKSIFIFTISLFVKYFSIILTPIFIFKNRKIYYKNILLIILVTLSILALSAFIFPDYLQYVSAQDTTHSKFLFKCFYNCTYHNIPKIFFGNSYFYIRVVTFITISIYLIYRFLYKLYDPFKYAFWIFTLFNLFLLTYITPWSLSYSLLFGILLFNKSNLYRKLFIIILIFGMLRYLGIYPF